MTVFHAYIHNILDDNTWRFVLTFDNRDTADEWWRAIAGSQHAEWFQRKNSQFYTHDPVYRNVLGFFYDTRFNDINGPFRGRLFLTLIDDRGGRGHPVIRSTDYVDHVSGGWFYIRSKSNPEWYWTVNGDNRVVASKTTRTQFQIGARGLPDGTIMIGSDTVTIQSDSRRAININDSGSLVATGDYETFRFDDLRKGTIFPERGLSSNWDSALFFDSAKRQVQWELV